METPPAPDPGSTEGMHPDVRVAVIEEIGKEIQSGADIIQSQRTRSAFTIWVGPYIVLGSILVAIKGGLTVDDKYLHYLGWAAVLYIGVGVCASLIERHILLRANVLRGCIASVANDGKLNLDDYKNTYLPKVIIGGYITVFFTLLACFYCVAMVAKELKPKWPDPDNPARANTPVQAVSPLPAQTSPTP
jgi:hypothetical protein